MPFIPLLFLISLCAAQDPDAETATPQLDRVTVYPGQALLERTVQVRADAPGPRVFVIGPLPVSAKVSSFQESRLRSLLYVAGQENGASRIGNTQDGRRIVGGQGVARQLER